MKIAKKKEKSYHRSYFPVVVWFDDLAKIFEILGNKEISISTSDYKFESLDELKEHFGPVDIYELKLSSSNPSASVDFDRISTTSFVFQSPTSGQLNLELSEVLASCQRRPTILYSNWARFFLPVLPAALSWVWNPKIAEFPILLPVNVLLLLWIVWTTFVGLRRNSVIKLIRRHEASSFFGRNRDQLLLLFMGAVVGGCITFAVGIFKDRVFPTTAVTPASQSK